MRTLFDVRGRGSRPEFHYESIIVYLNALGKRGIVLDVDLPSEAVAQGVNMISLRGSFAERFEHAQLLFRILHYVNVMPLQVAAIVIFLSGLLAWPSPAAALDSNDVNNILRGNPAKSASQPQSPEPDPVSKGGVVISPHRVAPVEC